MDGIGLAGVNILITGEHSTQVETDHQGRWSFEADGEVVITPRKTGFSFEPAQVRVSEEGEIVFTARQEPEVGFSHWGSLFSLGAAHTRWVSAVAWLPDGSRLISGSEDRTIRIWEVENGLMVASLTGHQTGITAMALSPKGEKLASGDSDGTIIIWDLTSNEQLHVLSNHDGYVSALDWSPDGSRLLSTSWDRTARVWDGETGEELLLLEHGGWVKAAAWSLDGSYLATGGDDRQVSIWAARTGEKLHTKQTKDWVALLKWGSGNQLAVGESSGKLRVFTDFSEDAYLELAGHVQQINAVQWSPKGKQLASASADGSIRIWN